MAGPDQSEPATQAIPLIVATTLEDERKARALGADAYLPKPIERETLLAELERLIPPVPQGGLLVVDDEEASRYVLRRLVGDALGTVHEATSGSDGLAMARSVHPRAILLDMQMPDLSGEQVLAALRSDPATRSIPVAIVTSQAITDETRTRLGCAILSKDALSLESVVASLAL